MACIQYPRKERGGVSLGSWEKPTIYKEPLKEVFTKKKERIEEGDITYNIRNDPSRYNDAITNWQKGKNMMVEIDYQNRAPQTTTMNFGSASNPYKVNKSFRPPEISLQDLQPLSRQQRPYVQAGTNVGSVISRDDSRADRMDKTMIDFSVGNTVYHTATASSSKEMGVYHDNFLNKDKINDDYTAKQVLSQLKGLESVELQKLFQYENTPNGIVLSPIIIQTNTSMNGAKHNALSNVGQNYSIQHNMKYGQGTNNRGTQNFDSQHYISESTYTIQPQIQIGQGTNQVGIKQYDSQRTIQEQNNVRDQFQVGKGTNMVGNQFNAVNHLQDVNYIQDGIQVGQGTNMVGNQFNAVNHLQDVNYIQDGIQVGQGTNSKGLLQQTEYEYQDQMKDILLKNMKSSVHIIIQRSGEQDEYPIHGSIKDKINIIVDSSKGQSITLDRGNGEPIKLKDYTWKFVKSANGSDKFIIQLPQESSLELNRKMDLYAMYTNLGNAIHQSEAEEVHLRREVRNTSAVSNIGLYGNNDRIDESLFVNRVEKKTNYTDMTVEKNVNSMNRDTPMVSIKETQSLKKQNIQQMMLKQSEGRFE
jgi:hypothetical protein